MSNITVGDDEGSLSSGEVQQNQLEKQHSFDPASTNNNSNGSSTSHHRKQSPAPKKKRNLPGNPDPTAEVVALSPTTLMATNRFVCEICNKGFQRDQNLQLHRRGHNLPWKLRQRTTTEVRKRVYICPEPTCVHHSPARALGDLTGIKKHYSRKHGEKKWKCDKCSKKYAVQSDWKAHQKTCGTREYKCDCGTIFSRRDSFITHRAFCDALAEENSKMNQNIMGSMVPAQIPDPNTSMGLSDQFNNPLRSLPQELISIPFKPMNMAAAAGLYSTASGTLFGGGLRSVHPSSSSGLQLSSNSNQSGYNYLHDSKNMGTITGSAHMSATALLQKAAQMGASATNSMNSPMIQKTFVTSMAGPDHVSRPGNGPNMVHHNSFDQFHHGPNEVAQLFDGSDMVMYGGMLMGGGGGDEDPGAGFLKNVVEVQEGGSDRSLHGRNGNSNLMGRSTTPARLQGNDMTTVDFMGVGGSMAQNMHEQRLEMEAMNQRQRMQEVMHNNPFHHQQLSDSDLNF